MSEPGGSASATDAAGWGGSKSPEGDEFQAELTKTVIPSTVVAHREGLFVTSPLTPPSSCYKQTFRKSQSDLKYSNWQTQSLSGFKLTLYLRFPRIGTGTGKAAAGAVRSSSPLLTSTDTAPGAGVVAATGNPGDPGATGDPGNPGGWSTLPVILDVASGTTVFDLRRLCKGELANKSTYRIYIDQCEKVVKPRICCDWLYIFIQIDVKHFKSSYQINMYTILTFNSYTSRFRFPRSSPLSKHFFFFVGIRLRMVCANENDFRSSMSSSVSVSAAQASGSNAL